MSEEIEILITQDGKAELKVKEGIGKTCVALTHEIEALLGTVIEKNPLPEYYQTKVKGMVRPIISLETQKINLPNKN